MNTQSISRTARALGGIAWAFDTIVRVTSKYAQKGIDKLNDRPTYYVVIEMPDKEGLIMSCFRLLPSTPYKTSFVDEPSKYDDVRIMSKKALIKFKRENKHSGYNERLKKFGHKWYKGRDLDLLVCSKVTYATNRLNYAFNIDTRRIV